MLAFVVAASAAEPAREIERILESGGAPQVVVACSPMSALLDIARQVPLPAATATRPDARFVMELLDPAVARARGFAVDGSVAFAIDDDEGVTVSIPFAGSAEEAQALLAGIAPPVATPTGWEMTTKEGRIATIRLEEGRLVWSHMAPGERRTPTPALLAELPTVPGCVAWLGFDNPKEVGPKRIEGSVFVPLAGGAPAALRFVLDVPAPVGFSAATVRPAEVSSVTVPTAVLVLGLPLDDLVAAFPREAAKVQTELAKLRNAVQLDGGATVAIFGNPRAALFVAAIPVRDGRGRPVPARRLATGMVAGLDAVRRSKTTFELPFEDKTVFGATADGVLFLGTDAVLVGQAASGEGTPWVTEAVASWAAQWPFALVGSVGEGKPQVRGGLRARDGVWEASFEVGGEQSPAATAAVVGIVTAIGIPNFVAAQKKAKRAEVPTNLASIAAALATVKAQRGAWVAAPAAPRAPEQLDEDSVAWVGGGAWDALGFVPDAKLRGSYWIEVSADGASATVHGMIDVDGDGDRAHYAVEMGGEVRQLTGEGVF